MYPAAVVKISALAGPQAAAVNACAVAAVGCVAEAVVVGAVVGGVYGYEGAGEGKGEVQQEEGCEGVHCV